MMNQDFKPEYDDSLQEYMNARETTNVLLKTAQNVNEDNASYVITESQNLRSLEESARSRWESARDSYLQ